MQPLRLLISASHVVVETSAIGKSLEGILASGKCFLRVDVVERYAREPKKILPFDREPIAVRDVWGAQKQRPTGLDEIFGLLQALGVAQHIGRRLTKDLADFEPLLRQESKEALRVWAVRCLAVVGDLSGRRGEGDDAKISSANVGLQRGFRHRGVLDGGKALRF